MNELFHIGVKRRSGRYPYGSGERPYQRSNEFGAPLFREARKQNLEKFGKDENYNILYIGGVSGSGKSTLALFLKKNNDIVIHLDSYFERKNLEEARSNRNNEFNNFLLEKGFDVSKLESNDLFTSDIKEYFTNVDKFSKLSEEFGKYQYRKGKRVIMEGVQVSDETLYADRHFYDKKPVIYLTTDLKISRQRAKERDMKHFVEVEEMDGTYNTNELFHIGVKGRSGRYPYGSGERPYQDRERATGIRGRIQTKRAEKKYKEMMKKRDELMEQARLAEEKQKSLVANKERVLRSGGPKELLQYKGQLTNREYEDAFKRLEYEQKLMAMTPSEYATNMKKIDNFMKQVKTVQQWADIGTDLYNSMARIYNTTDEGQKNPWRLVNKGQPQGQKDQKKDK